MRHGWPGLYSMFDFQLSIVVRFLQQFVKLLCSSDKSMPGNFF